MSPGGKPRFLSLSGSDAEIEEHDLQSELRPAVDVREASLGAHPRGIFTKKLSVSAVVLSLFVVGLVGLCRLPVHKDSLALRGLAQAASTGWSALSANSTREPSLFCWSHMEPDTYEVALIEMQLFRRASIFACDEFAVISTKKLQIGDIGGAPVYAWVNDLPKVPMGQNGIEGQTTDSFLNTQIFLLAWDSLIHSKRLWSHDFVVKVDPDAVFFPDRLRSHVKDHIGEAVYFPNCGKWGGKVLLYGSLEVFSAQALKAYEKNLETCKALPWKGWGEDYYMQHCMDSIGVSAVPDVQQVADDRCLSAECSDWTKVAFHDFKTAEEWYQCFKVAIGEKQSDEKLEMMFKK